MVEVLQKTPESELYPTPLVWAVIIDNNRVLVVKDSEFKGRRWTLPGAPVQFGEEPYEAFYGLKKQIFETLGLELETTREDFLPYVPTLQFGSEWRVILGFSCKVTSGTLVNENARWLSLRHIREQNLAQGVERFIFTARTFNIFVHLGMPKSTAFRLAYEESKFFTPLAS